MTDNPRLPEHSNIVGTMMRHRKTTVTVEYTEDGKRVVRQFTTAVKARRFYLAQSVAGADPKIVGQ